MSALPHSEAPDQINALVVAHRVLATPNRFRITDNEVLAMAGCLVGLDQVIDQLEAQPAVPADDRPTTNARLAAAIASFIKVHEPLAELGIFDGAHLLDADKAAFTALKTIFEQEFPHVGN